ncbi:hypothetical protein [Agromyces sp. NPDC058104]|uniref:hypothetical protein n=1 Tax=Agromyces sp. NPDC058104 TaxID=3346342 RepID=UPI0036DBEEFC
MKRLGAVLVLASVAAVVTGCAADEGGVIPSSFGRNGGAWQCTPLASDERVVIGDVLPAPGTDITVREVRLVHADGLTMREAYLLDGSGDAIGSAEYPPTLPEWDVRIPAAGTTAAAGEPLSVAVVVERGDAPGRADAIEIVYEVAGVEFASTGGVSFELTDRCA